MLDDNNQQCPVARALEVLGDRWALMILRDAFDGLRRFSEWQKNLGLAKNILATRLKLLVEAGLLAQQPASDGSAYKEYVLTEQGRAVFPIVIGLRQWGSGICSRKGNHARSWSMSAARGWRRCRCGLRMGEWWNRSGASGSWFGMGDGL